MGKLSPNNSIRNSSPLLESERKVVSYGKVGIVVLLFLMLFTVPVVAVGESSTPYLDLSYYPNPETPVDTQSLTLSLYASHARISIAEGNGEKINWEVDDEAITITSYDGDAIEIKPKSVGTATVRALSYDGDTVFGETTVDVTDSKKIYVNVSDRQNKFPLRVSLNATELNYMGYAVDEYGNYVPGVEITWENNNNDAYALSATPYTDVDSDIIQYYILSITDLKEMGDVSFSSDIHDQKYQHERQTWNFEITETTADSMGFDVLPNGVLFVDESYKVSAWVYDQYGLKTTLPIEWSFTNLENENLNNNYQEVRPSATGSARIEAKYGNLYVYHDITIETEEINDICKESANNAVASPFEVTASEYSE